MTRETAGRGHLRIFLGYAPGVGKTFAMLDAALREQERGRDVAVGIAVTHGRRETAALFERLPAPLPPKLIERAGVSVEELDVDACLARRPELLLVDELAHRNEDVQRHAKRADDVRELIEAGIDVWTTLNVQHIESVNDVVLQLTGVRVRETVPDDILDAADEIILVDIPPEVLLRRLESGKVYAPAVAARATSHFFRRGNLLGLRELALREAARRADREVRAFRAKQAVSAPWAVGSCLLAVVTEHPATARVLRAARRLADSDGQPFVVALLARSGEPRAERVQLLAERLGARVVRIHASAGVAGVGDVVIAENASVVVCGRQRRHRFDLRPTLTTQLLASIKGADVHIVDDGPDARGDSDDDTAPTATTALTTTAAARPPWTPTTLSAERVSDRRSWPSPPSAWWRPHCASSAPLTSSCSTSWRWS